MLVASEAVREDASGNYVWRVSGGVVERRTVETAGSLTRERVLVTHGLAIGDTVVRSAQGELAPGQSVRTE